MNMITSIRSFLTSQDGTTATEYAVMLALILLSVIVGVTAFGGGVSGWWTDIDTEFNTYGL